MSLAAQALSASRVKFATNCGKDCVGETARPAAGARRVLPSDTVDGVNASRAPIKPSTINHQQPLKTTDEENVALHKLFLRAMNRQDVEIAWQANASRSFRIRRFCTVYWDLVQLCGEIATARASDRPCRV